MHTYLGSTYYLTNLKAIVHYSVGNCRTFLDPNSYNPYLLFSLRHCIAYVEGVNRLLAYERRTNPMGMIRH